MRIRDRLASFSVALVLSLSLVACRRTPPPAPDAGAPLRVAAPDSPLARQLGADDAGRGEYHMLEDGPWCGFAPRVNRDKPLGPSSYTEPMWLRFFETASAPNDGPRMYDRAAFTLTLTGPSRVFIDESIALALSLTNVSAAPLHYGKPVDGSLEHWRGPFVDVYARVEGSGRTFRWTYDKGFGRCGNVDSRKADDYVTLLPGTRKLDPFGPKSQAMLAPVITTPGRYTLWIVYASSCLGADKGVRDGYDEPSPADLFEGTIVSNGISLDVTREK